MSIQKAYAQNYTFAVYYYMITVEKETLEKIEKWNEYAVCWENLDFLLVENIFIAFKNKMHMQMQSK